jgi:hypothetical protein
MLPPLPFMPTPVRKVAAPLVPDEESPLDSAMLPLAIGESEDAITTPPLVPK